MVCASASKADVSFVSRTVRLEAAVRWSSIASMFRTSPKSSAASTDDTLLKAWRKARRVKCQLPSFGEKSSFGEPFSGTLRF